MKKFTLFIASLFLTIGAMAQTNYGYGYPTGGTPSRDHHPISVSITGEDGEVQIVDGISTGTSYSSYFDKTENTFYVCCGETVTPKIVINGDWMHGYAYVDWNNDEQFTVNLTGDGPYTSGEGNELVAWSLYGKNTDGNSGHNTKGEDVSGCQGPEFNLGSFTVPENLEAGTRLRMRFAVMWNCIDPTGVSYTKFFDDGASIIDVTLEIAAPATDEEKAELTKYIGKAGDVLVRFADKSKAKAKGDKINIAGKISSNAAQNNADGNSGGQNDGAGIAGLTDTDATTYFHSRWGGTAIDEDHYLQIDLGDGETLSNFVFEYAVRGAGNASQTSPAPTSIEVRVSEDGTDFGEPIVTLTTDANNLPSYEDLGNTLWCSDVIEAGGINARYIRFTVTGSDGPGNEIWNNHYFFALGTLNLYSTKESDVFNAVKGEYAEKYTVEQVNAINESLAAANSIDVNANLLNKEVVYGAVNELKEALSPFYHLLKVSAAGYATLFLGFDAEIPTGAEVYIVKKDGLKEGYVTLTQVAAGALPAETGVIIKAGEGEYDFMATNDATADVTGNLLIGTTVDTNITEEAYVLGNDEGVGLYKAAKTNGSWLNNANKAYLPASALTQAQMGVASYGFDFGGNTTAVEKVEVENEVEEIYDLQGRRIDEITKPGIYIVNGNKVLVK